MIRVENLGKAYPSRTGRPKWVFRNLDFTIPSKANVGIIGRNGAGKSTLLRLIAGSDRPSEGEVIRDVRVSWPIGFGGGLQGSMTGRQNAQFVCRVQGREHDSEKILEDIKEFTNIGDNFDEPVKTYSDGMKARIKFAMSLAFEFDVYLSDEITSVGDTGFKRKAGERFRDMVGKAGLIMVSHSESQLREYCQSGILLQDGNAYWHDDIDDALKAYDATLHK